MAKPARSTPGKLSDFKTENIVGAPGFVRVGQNSAGQWWLIDANGRPFFSRGVAAVNRSGRAGGGAGSSNAYELAVEQHYGPADSPGFVHATLERLRSWHCNTLGAGSGPEFFNCGLFSTETVGFRQAAPETTIKLGGALLPDVFDPRWIAGCDTLAAEICALRRNHRELIGYFTDHGLQWAQPRPPGPVLRRERPSLLQICLSLEPGFPAYHAAWEFVLAAHAGELASLAQAWEIAPKKEALRQLTLADTPLLSDGYRRDQERFTREFAHRYFHTCAAAIRRYDPSHLVLGCAFESSPGAVVLAESVSPAVDVLTIACDDVKLFEMVDAYARATSLPIFLAEFSWAGEAFAQKQPHERRRLTKIEHMLANGRTAITRACTHPALVGYLWSRWADTDGDEPPFGRGLIHVDDREAREHTELFADLNARAESLRGGTLDTHSDEGRGGV